jgi:hypothetical protein
VLEKELLLLKLRTILTLRNKKQPRLEKLKDGGRRRTTTQHKGHQIVMFLLLLVFILMKAY